MSANTEVDNGGVDSSVGSPIACTSGGTGQNVVPWIATKSRPGASILDHLNVISVLDQNLEVLTAAGNLGMQPRRIYRCLSGSGHSHELSLGEGQVPNLSPGTQPCTSGVPSYSNNNLTITSIRCDLSGPDPLIPSPCVGTDQDQDSEVTRVDSVGSLEIGAGGRAPLLLLSINSVSQYSTLADHARLPSAHPAGPLPPLNHRFLNDSLQSSTGRVCLVPSEQPEGGEGVMALTAFPARTNLFTYLGRVISSTVASAPAYLSQYVLNDADSGLTVDAREVMSYGRYVQDPLSRSRANCEFVPPSKLCPHFQVRSTRRIKPGEELYALYGSAYWSDSIIDSLPPVSARRCRKCYDLILPAPRPTLPRRCRISSPPCILPLLLPDYIRQRLKCSSTLSLGIAMSTLGSSSGLGLFSRKPLSVAQWLNRPLFSYDGSPISVTKASQPHYDTTYVIFPASLGAGIDGALALDCPGRYLNDAWDDTRNNCRSIFRPGGPCNIHLLMDVDEHSELCMAYGAAYWIPRLALLSLPERARCSAYYRLPVSPAEVFPLDAAHRTDGLPAVHDQVSQLAERFRPQRHQSRLLPTLARPLVPPVVLSTSLPVPIATPGRTKTRRQRQALQRSSSAVTSAPGLEVRPVSLSSSRRAATKRRRAAETSDDSGYRGVPL